jgi:glycerol-3-phosphate acyltransferase PlsX
LIGNVVAKFCEGLGDVIGHWLEKELKDKLVEKDITNLITALRKATIPADAAGGGPLWGINGVICKAHGRSKAPEVASTIGTAKRTVEIDLVGMFKKELAVIKKNINTLD